MAHVRTEIFQRSEFVRTFVTVYVTDYDYVIFYKIFCN